MGWNDHVDWQLLDDIEDMVGYGILDEEEDADFIAAANAVAGYVDGSLVEATEAQKALFGSRIDKLFERLEDNRDAEWLEYQISKDD